MDMNCHLLFVYRQPGDSVCSSLFLDSIFSYNLYLQIRQHLPTQSNPFLSLTCSQSQHLLVYVVIAPRLQRSPSSHRSRFQSECTITMFLHNSLFYFSRRTNVDHIDRNGNFWRGGACGMIQLFVCDLTRCVEY